MRKDKIITLITLTGLVYAIAFIVTTFIFICCTPQLMNSINALSQRIFPSLPLAQGYSQFYIILSVSMMAGVTVCSLLLYKNAELYIEMAIPLMGMKFVSSLFGLLVFVSGFFLNNGWNNLANLVIFITDFPLGLWILYLYRLFKQEIHYNAKG